MHLIIVPNVLFTNYPVFLNVPFLFKSSNVVSCLSSAFTVEWTVRLNPTLSVLRAGGQRDPAFLLSSTQIVWQPGKEANESRLLLLQQRFCISECNNHLRHAALVISHRGHSVEWSPKCKFEQKKKVQEMIQDSSVCFIRRREYVCDRCDALSVRSHCFGFSTTSVKTNISTNHRTFWDLSWHLRPPLSLVFYQ